jgi:hypothetical protein
MALGFLDHTQRGPTFGRTPMDEWSARRRDLYLTIHNTPKRQISMPPAGFYPTIPTTKWALTHALDRAATGFGICKLLHRLILLRWHLTIGALYTRWNDVKYPTNVSTSRVSIVWHDSRTDLWDAANAFEQKSKWQNCKDFKTFLILRSWLNRSDTRVFKTRDFKIPLNPVKPSGHSKLTLVIGLPSYDSYIVVTVVTMNTVRSVKAIMRSANHLQCIAHRPPGHLAEQPPVITIHTTIPTSFT